MKSVPLHELVTGGEEAVVESVQFFQVVPEALWVGETSKAAKQ